MQIIIDGVAHDIGSKISYPQTNPTTGAPSDKVKYRLTQQNDKVLTALQAIAEALGHMGEQITYELEQDSTDRHTITLTGSNGDEYTVTIPDSDTWDAMVGATVSRNGTAGYAPAPPSDGYNSKYLRADCTWSVPPDTTPTIKIDGTVYAVEHYVLNGRPYTTLTEVT